MGTMPQRIAQWLPIASAIAPLYGQDPLDVAAVYSRESDGDPNIIGDGGHGHGLGQIDDRFHPSFIAATGPDGAPLWKKPAANILFICEVLSLNRRIFERSGVHNGLGRLCMLAAYNASWKKVLTAVTQLSQPISEEQLVQVLDPLTAPSVPGGPGDYLSDVLRRRQSYVLSP